MKLCYLFKPPCRKCPYRLRLVHTIRNPCYSSIGDAVYQILRKGVVTGETKIGCNHLCDCDRALCDIKDCRKSRRCK